MNYWIYIAVHKTRDWVGDGFVSYVHPNPSVAPETYPFAKFEVYEPVECPPEEGEYFLLAEEGHTFPGYSFDSFDEAFRQMNRWSTLDQVKKHDGRKFSDGKYFIRPIKRGKKL